MADVKVCTKCGWYEHSRFALPNECEPELGKIADELVAQAERAGVRATKLGYGYGKLTFELDEDTSLTVEPHHDGTYSVRKIHMLGDTYPSDVMLLVESLKTIRLRAAKGAARTKPQASAIKKAR